MYNSQTEQRPTTLTYTCPLGKTFALLKDKQQGNSVCIQKCSARTEVQVPFGKTTYERELPIGLFLSDNL